MVAHAQPIAPKPVRWIGSAREDVSTFPPDVRRRVGGALWEAQLGRKAPWAKPLRRFGDAAVLEIAGNFAGDTFRVIYSVRFLHAVCVLHAFQKKSRRGIAAPKSELQAIDHRLARAREDYAQWLSTQPRTSR